MRESFMKTKIIYISGNEIFDINDIRSAFEEVRDALNMDKTTVLFGVPVDADDSGITSEQNKNTQISEITEATPNVQEIIETKAENIPVAENMQKPVDIETSIETIEINQAQEPIQEQVAEAIEPQVKKRRRTRKETVEIDTPDNSVKDADADEPVIEESVVPILSILSGKEEPVEEKPTEQEPIIKEDTNIISEITIEENPEIATEIVDTIEITDPEEADLEKLLSAMTPLQEDTLEENIVSATDEASEEDNTVDATLEQLATEFAETQDKIVSENKSSTRSKIGKLRNILPFKQSKRKDPELGDLFGWAGVAANDEDFSMLGLFTNAASKK